MISAAGRSRSATIVIPPSFAKSAAVARPIPEPPPVTIVTLPWTRPLLMNVFPFRWQRISTGHSATSPPKATLSHCQSAVILQHYVEAQSLVNPGVLGASYPDWFLGNRE